jgi:hypothetical protein
MTLLFQERDVQSLKIRRHTGIQFARMNRYIITANHGIYNYVSQVLFIMFKSLAFQLNSASILELETCYFNYVLVSTCPSDEFLNIIVHTSTTASFQSFQIHYRFSLYCTFYNFFLSDESNKKSVLLLCVYKLHLTLCNIDYIPQLKLSLINIHAYSTLRYLY